MCHRLRVCVCVLRACIWLSFAMKMHILLNIVLIFVFALRIMKWFQIGQLKFSWMVVGIAITASPLSSTLMFCQTWGQYWLDSKYYFVHGYLIIFIEYTIIQFIVVHVVAVATCFKWKHFSHNCSAPHHSPRLSGYIFAVMYIYQLLYEVCKRIQLKL